MGINELSHFRNVLTTWSANRWNGQDHMIFRWKDGDLRSAKDHISDLNDRDLFLLSKMIWNQNTGAKSWFKISRSQDHDLFQVYLVTWGRDLVQFLNDLLKSYIIGFVILPIPGNSPLLWIDELARNSFRVTSFLKTSRVLAFETSWLT